MIVGTEWLIDAAGCNPETLRDLKKLRQIFARVINDLELKVLGDELWHQFPPPSGVTGLAMLTESHLACHTYPEHQTATFNLYCCRTRPEWNWDENLREMLAAETVTVQKIVRGESSSEDLKFQTKSTGGDLR
jgi:S-adenosylmethionine decarboxylase